ncbi:MAG: PIG-L deacetylase family protein [Dehalococcoidia bacterium]
MPNLLAIIPHPDDETYAFAGTIALAAKAGWKCHVHCASFGEGGERHDGGDPDPGMLALARARELDASCARLGAQPPDIWGLPDGGLAGRKEGVRKARSAMRRTNAAVVLSLGSDGAYGHPDHLAVHRWVQQAWETIEEKPVLLYAAFPPGLFRPQYERCVISGIMGDPPLLEPQDIGQHTADICVDIRAVAASKREAIAAHATQLQDGDPETMFPAGIVPALMERETYGIATGESAPDRETTIARLQELSPAFARC